jgi:hypothetical protein
MFSKEGYPSSAAQTGGEGLNPEGILSAFFELTTHALMGFL